MIRKFRVKRRMFHKLELYQKDDTIELDPATAGRLAFLGYVDGPLKEPRRRKRRKKDDKPAD